MLQETCVARPRAARGKARLFQALLILFPYIWRALVYADDAGKKSSLCWRTDGQASCLFLRSPHESSTCAWTLRRSLAAYLNAGSVMLKAPKTFDKWHQCAGLEAGLERASATSLPSRHWWGVPADDLHTHFPGLQDYDDYDDCTLTVFGFFPAGPKK